MKPEEIKTELEPFSNRKEKEREILVLPATEGKSGAARLQLMQALVKDLETPIILGTSPACLEGSQAVTLKAAGPVDLAVF